MQEVLSQDGSYTLYSKEFKQHYHSLSDGALNESLIKHIIPALAYHKDKNSLKILDICFGLGYNSLATLYYLDKLRKKDTNISIEKAKKKVEIYSPELDKNLINSLEHFPYPKEFDDYKHIIKCLSSELFYEDENIKIQIFNLDARTFVKNTKINFDIIYQDAFSKDVNPLLWTKEFFEDIYNKSNKDAILTTYSIARGVRQDLHNSGFFLFEYIPIKRKSTLAFKSEPKNIAQAEKQENRDFKDIFTNCKSLENKLAKPQI